MPSSTFDTGLEGWTTTVGTEIFEAGTGMPAGSLRGVEGGSGVWYFSASSAYLGDMSAFYGGSLSFDLKQDGAASQFDDKDIIITGGGITLVYDFGPNPGTDWTHYSVSLALGGGWRIDSLSGRIATDDEIRTVLANLDGLLIRGEFVNGTSGDAANLDNVDMSTTPAPPPVFLGGQIVSDFANGIDGWSFEGDVDEFHHVATGGNPDGYLELVDFATGDTCYFVAADKFVGNKAAFSGGTLSFDLKQSSTSSQFNNPDVILIGGGLTLVVDLSPNPGTDWTHFYVNLDTSSDWRLDTLGGTVATQAQINQVLASLTEMRIRAEFRSGDDTDGIDNVVMTAPDANVRLLADSSVGALISNHDLFADALAAASLGNAILIEDAAGVPEAGYSVAVNGLTVISDAPLSTTLNLTGVKALSLVGANGISVMGNASNNTLLGSAGDNTLRGFKGNDTLSGGDGRDSLIGDGGADFLSGGGDRDTLKGGNGNDLLLGGKGVDLLNGGGGRDLLVGNAGKDKMFGKSGNDTLKGGSGNDTLDGGTGNDKLVGQGGSDRFKFRDGFGADTIVDFDATDDAEQILLSRVTGITDFADLSANHMATVTGGVLIDDLAGNTIFLKGVALADLHDVDFIF